ncbi:MAG: thiamine pyrophosphate-dependent dehydrogenase E1 component subunit alpha [Proteobacteria bacterium]|nr:thiamine pyrophosphate-dependent dehydrogenase E1 component subunit alpha [Pseudomonadota bacterium]
MASKKYELTQKEALDLYFKMLLTRKTENAHEELFQKQMVPVYTHLGTGQEAAGCGASAFLEPEDYVIGTHRGVAEYIGKGLSVENIFLEYGGRATSGSGGRAGLHLHSRPQGVLPLAGSLGSDFSLAVGAGLSLRNQGRKNVVVDYFGEGAAEAPDFHGAMNMAVLYRVPVVFCCATNQFVEYHPYRDSTCAADIAVRAEAYCMPWKIVRDGNDMFAVGQAMKEALDHARSGKGPYFIECKTYRLAPHHTGDPCVYRDAAEVKKAWKNDPIPRAEKELLKRKWATETDIEDMGDRCERIIAEAVEALKSAPLPDPASIMDHIHAG